MAITGEDAQSEVILLDPVLSFGLVDTASKTKSYSNVAVTHKDVEVQAGEITNIAECKNVNAPSGVTFLARLRLKFTVPPDWSKIFITNKNSSLAGYDTGPNFGLQPEGSSYDVENTGEFIFVYNLTQNTSLTVNAGSEDNIDVYEGDEVVIDIPLKDGWMFRCRLGPSGSSHTITMKIFDRIDATIYHDGSLTGGKGVECTFEVYDSDGSTLLGTYTFEGMVNPFVETSITKNYGIKAGLTRLIEADCGDYKLDPSAPDHYLRAVLVDIKDRATGNSVSLDEFNNISIGLQLKDPDTEDIIAYVDPEEVASLPFTGSWTNAISAPSSAKTYKAILVLMVNPKQAKRYEVDCLIQLGM